MTPSRLPPAGTFALQAALDRNDSLAPLLERVRQSRQRFDAIGHLIPAALRDAVRPGPLDEHGWVLLAAHSAAAAKIRQLLPSLQSALLEQGWNAATAIKVRVLPRV